MRVRRATWLSALALSCTATPPVTPVVEDSGQPLPDTGGGGVVQSDPGWTLGEVSACPSPVAASWTNASDLLDRSLPVQGLSLIHISEPTRPY